MHLSTLLTTSPARLAGYISNLRSQHTDRVLLFALSPNLASEELAQLIRQLTSFSSQTLGCLSAPLPHDARSGLLSCSFALFDPKKCTPFRSQIPGREAPQVGRYHSFRRKRDSYEDHDALSSSKIDWDSVWDQSVARNEPPDALRGLRPDGVGTILYFTDGAPEGLSSSLSRFQHANKLGLFAASTPFITGRTVTLFMKEQICDTGAVGLALTKPASECRMSFKGLTPIATPMSVSQSEGNLVITLDNKNPTQLLLSAIRQADIDLTNPDYDQFCLGTMRNGEPYQMFSILSGDPSRGTIALRSPSSPPPGSQVQFFHRPNATAVENPDTLVTRQHAFGFAAVPELLRYTQAFDRGEEDFELELPDTFLAGSENGFLVSRGSETPWTCSIPGGVATLNW